MKKFFSILIVVTTIFTFTAFAGDQPPVTTCADGHMHLPGYTCAPPNNKGTGDENSAASEDSILAYIKSLIDEYTPFF